MKHIVKHLLFAILAVIAVKATAQDKKPVMQRAPVNVNVDGKLTEWGDSLAMYDSKTRLNYTIANNDTALYIIAFIADKQLKRKIMAGGITISVNSEGKKHKTSSITYPIPDKAAFAGRSHGEDGDDLPKPSLIESTSIRVAGFKDVESDMITTNNTYGFKAAIGFDDKHNLIYETAIPLSMLNLKKGKNANDLAINISVNGIEKPANNNGQRGGGMESGGMGGGGGMPGGGMGGGGMGGGRRGGGGGGGRGGNRGGSNPSAESSGMSQGADFWVELGLAKP